MTRTVGDAKKAASRSAPPLFVSTTLVASGGGSDILDAVLVAGLAHPAARSRGLCVGIIAGHADGGGQHAKRNSLISLGDDRSVTPRALGPLPAFGTIIPFAPLGAMRAVLAIGAWRTLSAGLQIVLPLSILTLSILALSILTLSILALSVLALPVLALRVLALAALALPVRAVAARRGALIVAVVIAHLAIAGGHILIAVIVLVAAATLVLLLEAGPAILEHAEIMIRELEIIFGLHAVPGQLHVARQGLVLFEQLRGVAALAVVLAVAIGTTGGLGTLSTTTATAAALTIVDQVSCSLSHGPRDVALALEVFLTLEALSRRGDRPTLDVAQVDPPLPPGAQVGASTAISSGVGGEVRVDRVRCSPVPVLDV